MSELSLSIVSVSTNHPCIPPLSFNDACGC